jgi:hypothetical protein
MTALPVGFPAEKGFRATGARATVKMDLAAVSCEGKLTRVGANGRILLGRSSHDDEGGRVGGGSA